MTAVAKSRDERYSISKEQYKLYYTFPKVLILWAEAHNFQIDFWWLICYIFIYEKNSVFNSFFNRSDDIE